MLKRLLIFLFSLVYMLKHTSLTEVYILNYDMLIRSFLRPPSRLATLGQSKSDTRTTLNTFYNTFQKRYVLCNLCTRFPQLRVKCLQYLHFQKGGYSYRHIYVYVWALLPHCHIVLSNYTHDSHVLFFFLRGKSVLSNISITLVVEWKRVLG